MRDIDFTSSLYLGFRHPGDRLAPFRQLTTGAPAAIGSPGAATDLAMAVAHLMGFAAGTLGTSTLHIFFDLFGVLCRARAGLAVIGDIYPIALWGAERAAAAGIPAVRISGLDPAPVSRQAAAWRRRGIRPVLVTDGVFYPQGRMAPLAAYAGIAEASDGLLVVDDTQALGILGRGPTAAMPYGRGGGGSFRHGGLGGPHLVAVVSLAKAFGVPVAVLAGSPDVVRDFEALSATRRHNSPPSLAMLAAGARALALNRRRGGRQRARLLDNVRGFRRALAAGGLRPDGGLMPVQTVGFAAAADPRRVRAGLAAAGIHALLAADPGSGRQAAAFAITAAHRSRDIERAAAVVAALLPRPGARPAASAPVDAFARTRRCAGGGAAGRARP